MDEELVQNQSSEAVADSAGDTDIDQLLRARNEIDAALRRYKTEFTVLFTDIVGSTAFFEQYGDTAGLMMLQRHHELVVPSIEKGGGTVVKTIGDAVMAVFSSPVAAVKAAIEIHQRLDAHNEDCPPSDQLHTRTGLNFGRGFVKEKDVFGDVVNTAARFVKRCAPAQILFSRAVYDALRAVKGFKCRKIGSTTFHGKAGPEDLYEVLWTNEQRYNELRRRLDSTKDGKTTRTLIGRYEILGELGRGAMGVVYKAHDPTVERIVALKTVRLDTKAADRAELVQRLRQEAQAIGRLEHPNIVTLYDAGEGEGLFYLTMQFIKGRMLSQVIAERTLLPVPQIVLLFEQVCEGLEYAHERGIVHRDLKPSNVIVTPEGVAKIVDFGVAKLSEDGMTKAGAVLGTPSYMSPEQAQGGRVDRRSDIFSLGTILYELLTGEKAFPGKTPTAIIHKILYSDPIPLRVMEPGIEPVLESIVRKALAKDPFQRYQNCGEMRGDLSAFRTGKVKEIKAVQPGSEVGPAGNAGLAPPVGSSPVTGASRVVRKPANFRIAPPVSRKPRQRGVRVAVAAAALLLWGTLGVYSGQQGWLSTANLPSLQAALSKPEEIPSILAETVGNTWAALIEPTVDELERKYPPSPPPPQPQQPATGGAGEPESVPKEDASAEGNAPTVNEPARKTETASAQPAVAESAPAAEPPATKEPEEAKPPRRRRARSRARPTLSPEKQQEIQRWFRQAEQYIQKGTYSQANFALRQVLRIDPNNTRAKKSLEKVRRMQELQQ